MSELLRLRVKDVDFSMKNVYIFDGKSQRDRILPLPDKVQEDLRIHIDSVNQIHQ